MTNRPSQWLTRDAFLLSLSAFFADLGYQAVTALFPLFVVEQLHRSALVYGVIAGASFGVGSFWAYLGGKAGDRFSRKTMAILGNLFIPLMSLSGLAPGVWSAGALFALGWWARYFRTPVRRALLVEASHPEHRSQVFGFLHALDIGGGMLSVLGALLLLLFRVPVRTIMLFTALPLLVSTLVLFFVQPQGRYAVSSPTPRNTPAQPEPANRGVFRLLLAAAALYGFSFYNLGFPILTTAEAAHSTGRGVLSYVVYLGISAVVGYSLGAARLRPLNALWKYGYLLAAIASLSIGLIYLLHLPFAAYYLAVGLLGASMGAVETFEPTLTARLNRPAEISSGMGWLSASRALGQFISNFIMGWLFAFGQFNAYLYAFAASLLAAVLMRRAEQRSA